MKNYTEIRRDIRSNWSKKDEKRKLAAEHHNKMLLTEKDSINYSIDNSKIYGPDFYSRIEKGSPVHIFVNTDTVSAIKKYNTDNICALNFASYKNPGGKFIDGSMAQEEALCHESTLYEVLSNDKIFNYYDWNRRNLNRGLYLNRAVYSKNIKFDNIYCDILTCASPNWGCAMQYCKVDKKENSRVLQQRCQFIADILNDNCVKTFIAGAFGCGVFGQDPEEVANIWKSVNWGSVETVIHAVPGETENARVFMDILK